MPQLPCNKTILKVCKNSMHLRWGMVLRINDLFPIDPITSLEIKAYIEKITYDGSNIEATLTLSENIDAFLSVGGTITFHGDRGLNFHAERNITGVNIIDGMIFWTDNYSEPKKVNIERGKIGSTSWKYGAGYDGSQLRERTTWNGKSNTFLPINNFAYYSDFDQHTKLIIDESTVHECEKSTIFCPVLGCTDPNATNYDLNATVNDGSCTIPPVPGCTDPTACNYDPLATSDDGSCILPDGCTDTLATNYDASALCDDGSCVGVSGCMDQNSSNYNPLAVTNDGSCCVDGCTASFAFNYDPNATCNTGTWSNSNLDGCYPVVYGCTNPLSTNYITPTGNLITDVNTDDGSCEIPPPSSNRGCIVPTACNYNPTATIDDGSCDWMICTNWGNPWTTMQGPTTCIGAEQATPGDPNNPCCSAGNTPVIGSMNNSNTLTGIWNPTVAYFDGVMMDPLLHDYFLHSVGPGALYGLIGDNTISNSSIAPYPDNFLVGDIRVQCWSGNGCVSGNGMYDYMHGAGSTTVDGNSIFTTTYGSLMKFTRISTLINWLNASNQFGTIDALDGYLDLQDKLDTMSSGGNRLAGGHTGLLGTGAPYPAWPGTSACTP